MNTPTNTPTSNPEINNTETKAEAPINGFAAFKFPDSLAHTLVHMKYESPTPVQAKAIPYALEGRDILASAQTGTGKTGAFAIPLVAKLLESMEDSVLVLTPTRELAAQVMSIFQQLLGKRSKIKTALLIGGEPIGKQFRQLDTFPRIIVGTPGRVNDHLIRKSLRLNHTKHLVLDEMDRMLDMGFDEQIEAIICQIPGPRQTLMFSATIAPRIATLSKKYLNNPERIDCGKTNTPAAKIKQENIHTSEKAKYDILTQELEKREGSIIVFVKTKRDADTLATRLRKQDHRADAIHGDLQQRRRDRVINDFRQKRYRIMVATDVASRGLDIPHIEHVINFNLPHCPEDYIHRIGRTARAGAQGSALNLISPEDDKKWKAIHRLLNPSAYPERGERDHSSRSAPRNKRYGSSSSNRFGYQNNQSNRGGSSSHSPFGQKPAGRYRQNGQNSPSQHGYGQHSHGQRQHSHGQQGHGQQGHGQYSQQGQGSQHRQSAYGQHNGQPRNGSNNQTGHYKARSSFAAAPAYKREGHHSSKSSPSVFYSKRKNNAFKVEKPEA